MYGQVQNVDVFVPLNFSGGLGSVVIGNLAAAGVGELIICDNDIIDLSNLNRQIIYR